MMIDKHNNDITMNLLPFDASEFFCFIIVGEEGASSKCSDESDSFIYAGSLASELTK